MEWEECTEKFVKIGSKDVQRARSLASLSLNRMKMFERTNPDENNVSVIISNIYDSILEVCQAIACSKGYKIYNHECITAFFKVIEKKNEIVEKFDRFRKIRISINYYGKRIELKEGISILDEMKKLYNELLKIAKF